ncbi:MAG: winged helix-turn-helix domain-containing protein [Dehalococcoidales bacterium]|jgi:predicted transcriptional regulator
MQQPKDRRDNIEIVADILRLLRLGYASKFEIQHTSRITNEQALNYLEQLIRVGALENAEEKMGLPSFRITKKGLALLSKIESLREMLPLTDVVDVLHQSKIVEMNIGQVLFTRGVREMTGRDKQFTDFVQVSLERYRKGDWGEMSDDEKRLNDISEEVGRLILATYESRNFPEIWITTSPDRSYSTVLFPEEYSSAEPLEPYELGKRAQTADS